MMSHETHDRFKPGLDHTHTHTHTHRISTDAITDKHILRGAQRISSGAHTHLSVGPAERHVFL